MSEHDPDPVREIVAAMRAALPTSRHAGMVVDAVVAALGDDAVVETRDQGRMITVFRRDVVDCEAIVPWPLLTSVTGRRLGYVMGAEGPPTDEAPPGAGGPSPRLSGLTPGEFEIADEGMRISVTFAQDGRVCETSCGGSPGGMLAGFAGDLRRRGRNPVEILADRLAAFDPGRLGPGRLLRPQPSSCLVEGTWHLALNGVRDALFAGLIPGPARWVAADGYEGTVVCAAAARAEALERCREEIRKCRPRPPEPRPPPEFSPETLAEFGLHGGPFLITTPGDDGPRVEPTPENTPILLLEFPPLPDAPPPPGTWFRLLDDRGHSSAALLRRDRYGLVLAGDGVLAPSEFASLDAALDDADRRDAERFPEFVQPKWPAELPPLRSTLNGYSIARSGSGTLVAEVHSRQQNPEFAGHFLRPDTLAGGVLRQRWRD